ncbi:hypothetical protein BDV96DRAFT_639432 [Lophiotrema nucula]|uniref:Uncharacterized protein n=1 Tax=Lophiotrema nucula TaxID=690887 RepID=A0A6A5ZV89_9PLEO|nr:hypothetical protein BDV96DRAFT_639432 [Lophiotrema nucula]
MLPQHVLVALVAAVSAVPLNINLGAYSPALVVGDGEISLGSTESASELMATLAQGAQQNGQQQGEQQGQQQEQQQQEQQQEGEQPAEKRAARRSETIAIPAPNVKRDAEPISEVDAMEAAVKWIKRDINSFNAALSYAREALKDTPKIELGTENAGVGIIQNAGLNVPANSAANGQNPAGKAKRSEVVAEESEAPKMTLVAITEV